ncbi:polymer-forming cytoskeletal protein [Candidatus Villigracilis affinis]|uniref:polymer-forming cytoskeletal protein n=1 Tax=Candidatus Villigracilis affinis TaxID=3140682 RepID=UPI001E038F09|nr:hypothetical protein [Anaerolineales bacterium]
MPFDQRNWLCGCALIASRIQSHEMVVKERNYTPGDPAGYLFAQNADLLEGSSVDGSVIMLCCNLIVSGEVKGDVFLLTGNLKVENQADVNGDINVLSGNVSK